MQHHACLGHDRDLAARLGRAARPRGWTRRASGRTGTRRAGCPPPVEGRLIGPDGDELPWDGEAVGELEVRGTWITARYYRRRRPDKFHDGWLRTGDVGTLSPDGFLRLTDRAKDVIKSGGEWISSVDLENHLMAHPDVIEASVIARARRAAGASARWPPSCCARARRPTSATLRDFLATRVARWQLPERWAFIDEVPKTSVGKFDKKALRGRYAAGELEVTSLA